MKKRMVIAIAALVLVFGAIFGWKAFGNYIMNRHFATFQPPPVTVSTGKASIATWQPRIEAIGSLNAVRGVDISAEVAGIVKEIRFRSGDRVKQGALLVQLDDSAEQAELPGLRARLRQAERNLTRTREIVSQGLASQEALDTAQSEYDQAHSAVRSRETAIAKKAVRAPFTGMLGIRQVDIGEYLQAGAPIVTLQALDPMLVDFMLPQQQLGHIRVGQAVLVRSDALPDRTFEGRITAISPKIDPASRNFAIQGEVKNDAGELRSGMFVQIHVATGESVEQVTVPRTAVNYSLYGDSVFVVVERGEGEAPVAEERFVRLGEERAGRVAVLEGVAAGETVVTAGQLKLRSGSRVIVDNDVALN